jgi:hypothetical protein
MFQFWGKASWATFWAISDTNSSGHPADRPTRAAVLLRAGLPRSPPLKTSASPPSTSRRPSGKRRLPEVNKKVGKSGEKVGKKVGESRGKSRGKSRESSEKVGEK